MNHLTVAVDRVTYFHRFLFVKRALHRAMHTITRSRFSARVDVVHADSRAESGRKTAEGKAWNGIRENAALLGIRTDSTSRPKMVFGAGH
jgi:hypothetical protein